MLTSICASGSDNNVKIAPAKNFSLEEAMEYIQKDELLEVTQKSRFTVTVIVRIGL